MPVRFAKASDVGDSDVIASVEQIFDHSEDVAVGGSEQQVERAARNQDWADDHFFAPVT